MSGISADNSAVFLVDPTKGPGGKVLVAQITVKTPCSKGWTAKMGLTGKTTKDVEWRDYVTFGWTTGSTTPPRWAAYRC